MSGLQAVASRRMRSLLTVLGIGLGAGSTVLLNHFTSLLTVFSPPAVMVALIIAAGIGLVFGVFPAIRAARLAPIEALRAA